MTSNFVSCEWKLADKQIEMKQENGAYYITVDNGEYIETRKFKTRASAMNAIRRLRGGAK